jgi:hypothetical protein
MLKCTPTQVLLGQALQKRVRHYKTAPGITKQKPGTTELQHKPV